jgi:hypothetical protein
VPLLQMVFGENGASVHSVMIGGRVVFRDGKLLTLDESLLRRQAQEAADRLDRANAGTCSYGRAAGRNILSGARLHRPCAAAKTERDLRRLIVPLIVPWPPEKQPFALNQNRACKIGFAKSGLFVMLSRERMTDHRSRT